MQITTFLMFEGSAEAAMNFYISLFPRSQVVSIDRYAAGELGKEGSVKKAIFEINGSRLMCIDSPAPHAFTFTPSISLFVDCDEASEIDRLYQPQPAGVRGRILSTPYELSLTTRCRAPAAKRGRVEETSP